MSKFVTVQGSLLHGTVLVASQPLHAGLDISTEFPLLLVPGLVSSRDADSTYRAYQAFLLTSPSAQAQILDLFSPVHGLRASHLRAKVKDHPRIGLLPVLELEILVKVAMVWGPGCEVPMLACCDLPDRIYPSSPNIQIFKQRPLPTTGRWSHLGRRHPSRMSLPARRVPPIQAR